MNIALVNELKFICAAMGIDTWVIAAAKTRPELSWAFRANERFKIGSRGSSNRKRETMQRWILARFFERIWRSTRFLWSGRWRLFQRRTVWCPTVLGLLGILLPPALVVVWWCISGEAFLSSTRRLPAQVLVVEGWIGSVGVQAAATEFRQGRYKYVVATGGVADAKGWGQAGWSFAEGADHELIRSGVPEEQIIFAPSRATASHRTYESAVAVFRALEVRGIHPKALNVFTLGPHVKRSCLVFAKVLGPGTEVGGVDWTPFDYRALPWWRSSDRAKDLITESAGYLYEVLFNSGRSSTRALADPS